MDVRLGCGLLGAGIALGLDRLIDGHVWWALGYALGVLMLFASVPPKPENKEPLQHEHDPGRHQ